MALNNSPRNDSLQRHSLKRLLTTLVGSSLLASLAVADTISLTPTKDNTIWESPTGGISNGAGLEGFSGVNNGGQTRRVLMHFDVFAAIPSGSTINSVSLDLTVTRIGAIGLFSNGLHTLTADWGEGTSNAGNPGGMGATATPGDATWTHAFHNTVLWASPGGDFNPTASALVSLGGLGAFNVTALGMTSDVQAWLDNPSANFGWMLRDQNETGGVVAIAMREDATNGPMLNIDFTPPSSGTILTFCDPADLNSTGFPTVLAGTLGSSPGSGLHLEATQGPAGNFGYFLVGTGRTEPGFVVSNGHLCLAVGGSNAFGRYNVPGGNLNSIGIFDVGGILQNSVGTSTAGSGFDVPSMVPISGNPTITSGDTWHFQLWHREAGGASNLSNGVSVTF